MRLRHFTMVYVILCFLLVLGCNTPDNPTFGPNHPDPNPSGSAPATLNAITPASALPGRNVVITGSGFNTNPLLNLVNFGNKVAKVNSATATQLDVALPSMSGEVEVRVAVKGSELWSNKLPFMFESFIPTIDNPEVTIIDETIAWPNGIAIDDNDNIYVGSGGDGVIYRIAPDGSRSEFATDINPHGAMHFGPQKYLYVCSGGGDGDGTVSRVSPDGSSVETVAEVEGAIDLDWDENGNMYIVSNENGLFMIAAGGGAVTELITDIGSVKNCRVFDGYLYVSKIWDNTISRFEITDDGLGDEEVYFEPDTPISFDFDENGTLYWAFAWDSYLSVYAPGGAEEADIYEDGIIEQMRYMFYHKDRIYVVNTGGSDVGIVASVFIGVNQAPRYGSNL